MTESHPSFFLGSGVFLLILLLFNVSLYFMMARNRSVKRDPKWNEIQTLAGSLSLALGGFGICYTLFSFFSALEVSSQIQPGDNQFLMPIAFSLVAFVTSASVFFVSRSK